MARDLDAALALLAADPEGVLLNGGTDLMVEINFGRKRPGAVIAIDRVAELRDVSLNGTVRLGAGVTFTMILERDCGSVALREAARTVGSPPIRNAATIGGNVATSSPAGDSLPVLAALDATVHLRSVRGERAVRFAVFITGQKKNVRAADERATAGEWNDAGRPHVFLKGGTPTARTGRASRRPGVGLTPCAPAAARTVDEATAGKYVS